ncbi:hypothetical protein [Nonomuraea rubra]|uniref:hypothetical protein n=1 Tax=Nonomuraea rubra TaxID=46180 RepID=UPI0031F10877
MHRLRLTGRAVTVAAVLALASSTMTPARAAAAPDVVAVDFAQRTGPVHGGATGLLYGLSDPGVPETPCSPAPGRVPSRRGPRRRPAPQRRRARGRDGLPRRPAARRSSSTCRTSTAAGPYENLGIDDYLAKVDTMVRKVVREPAGGQGQVSSGCRSTSPTWASGTRTGTPLKEKFFGDWKAVVERIRSIDPQARIVGPNRARYNPGRLRDFLTWAKGATCGGGDCLPDIMAWHELSRDSLAGYRGHHEHYRALERELGIGPLPVTSTSTATGATCPSPASWSSGSPCSRTPRSTPTWRTGPMPATSTTTRVRTSARPTRLVAAQVVRRPDRGDRQGHPAAPERPRHRPGRRGRRRARAARHRPWPAAVPSPSASTSPASTRHSSAGRSTSSCRRRPGQGTRATRSSRPSSRRAAPPRPAGNSASTFPEATSWPPTG